LSSGLRVNSAADDAAGLAIREQMRADIATLEQGIRNASDAISLIQTAEGAMSVIDEKLTRMKELAEQAATGTYTTAQRLIMDSEYQAMADEITRIANATDFNGVKLLDGSLLNQHDGDGLKIHFGTGNDSDEDYYYIQIGDMRASTSTGLRVGQGDNYWQTTGVAAASADTALANTGVFGMMVSNDGGATYEMYSYVSVDEGDTLNDVANEINAGRAAVGAVGFVMMDGTTFAGTSFTLGAYTISFTSASTSSLSGNTLSVGVGTTAGVSAATVAMQTAAALNTVGLSTMGIYGAADGDVLRLMTVEGGVADITIDVSGTSIMSSDTMTPMGPSGGVSAQAYENDATGEWELRINTSGDTQVALFALGTSIGDTGTVLDGTATAVSSSWGSGAVINSAGSTVLSGWSDGDEASEWTVASADWAGQGITTQSGAQEALSAIDDAITTKDTARANLGALQNRLENTITNLTIQAENLQAAESQISDADIATEMTEFTSNNILAQAAVAMLAQANSLPTLALSLLSA
jgi:flagellin